MKRNAFVTTAAAIAAALALAAFDRPLQAADARSENWQLHCSVCHGDDGKGQTEEGRKKKARNLTNERWQGTLDDARIVSSITKGHHDMPAFRKKLTEPEIKALAAEVRCLVKKPS